MIKTSKLMLGDLVRLNGQIVKVVSLYKNHKGSGGEIIVDSDLKIFNSLVRDEDIEPIPLTEEILLKNGFRKTGSFIELVEYALNDVDTEICVFYNIESNTPYFYAEIANVEVELKDVHHLQHLLRLCGSNELADNLKI